MKCHMTLSLTAQREKTFRQELLPLDLNTACGSAARILRQQKKISME